MKREIIMTLFILFFNSNLRNKFIEIASQVDIYLDDDRIDSEWAYNTASEIVKNMFEKGE